MLSVDKLTFPQYPHQFPLLYLLRIIAIMLTKYDKTTYITKVKEKTVYKKILTSSHKLPRNYAQFLAYLELLEIY